MQDDAEDRSNKSGKLLITSINDTAVIRLIYRIHLVQVHQKHTADDK